MKAVYFAGNKIKVNNFNILFPIGTIQVVFVYKKYQS